MRLQIAFVHSAAAKFGSGGKFIATEPYFSAVSTLIFKLSASRIGRFTDFRARTGSCGGGIDFGEYCIALADFLQETGMVATLE